MMIDSDKLKEIINGFAEKDKKVFSKEVQFQFDLAWEIKRLYSEYECVLEYLYLPEKYYIDMVVFSDKEKKCIPIELKYKTTDKEIEYKVEKYSYWTYNQGACDNGSYDYLKDIQRIESLGKYLIYKGINYEIEKGYAIILTNDWHYYSELPPKTNNIKGYKRYYWEKFSLAQEEVKGDLCWIKPESLEEEIDEGGLHTSADRRYKIHLENSYMLKDNWNPYKVPYKTYLPKMKKEPKFKYLISEIRK